MMESYDSISFSSQMILDWMINLISSLVGWFLKEKLLIPFNVLIVLGGLALLYPG